MSDSKGIAGIVVSAATAGFIVLGLAKRAFGFGAARKDEETEQTIDTIDTGAEEEENAPITNTQQEKLPLIKPRSPGSGEALETYNESKAIWDYRTTVEK